MGMKKKKWLLNRSQKNLEDTLKNSSKIQRSDSLGETVEKK